MGLTLIVLNGPGKGRVFELDGQQPELIGRAAPRLRIPDTETSRRHAEIRYEKETWIIRDLGSTNGTYVNGRRLTGLTELEEGDQILVGRVLLVVGQILPAGAAAAPSSGDGATALASPWPEEVESPLDGEAAEEELVAEQPRKPADLAAPPPPTPSAAKVLAEDDADEDFDLAELDAFEFGAQSEGAADGADDQAAAVEEPAAAGEGEEERGFLASNRDVMEFAERVVREERGESAPEDEAATDGDEGAGAGPDEATGLLSVDAEKVNLAAPADVEPPAASSPDEADDAEGLLAELAAANTDDADNPWPDLDLSLDDADEPQAASPTETGRPAPPQPQAGAIKAAANRADEGNDLEDDLGFDVTEDDEAGGGAAPTGGAPAAVVHADDEDGGSGTGLLHHVGLPSDIAAGKDWEASGDGAEESAALASLDEADEIEADLLQGSGEAEGPLGDGGDAEGGSDERGVGLASIVPPVNRDEGPTTIINEAVQTHAPYEQRHAKAGGGVPAEQWVAPPREAAPTQPDTQDTAGAPTVEQSPRAVAKRRGLLAVLLSCLVLAGGLAGAWYAVGAGGAGAMWPNAAAESGKGELPDRWQLADKKTIPAGEAKAQPAPPEATGGEPAPAASFARAGVFREWSLGEAPPEMALTNAPRLLGGRVLDGRVGEPPTPAEAEATPPPAVAEATEATPPPPAGASMTSGEREAEIETALSAMPAPPAVDASPQEPAGAAAAPSSPPAQQSDAAANADAVEAPAPTAPAENVAATGRRVAFVVNASGSVLDTLTQLVAWTHRAIGQLKPQDQFAVIFFRRGEAIEPPPAGLRRATDETKASVRKWTDLVEGNLFPSGQSDPSTALQRALELGVEEIYLVSDDSLGRGMTGDEAAEALDLMAQLIGGRDVRIHTVQFFYGDPQNMLRRMAERFGGTYRFIEPDEPAGPDPLEVLNNLSAAPGPPPSSQ